MKINGRTVTIDIVGGMNLTLSGNVLTVNGKRINLDDEKDKNISIVVEGNVDRLEADACDDLTIKGDVQNVKTASGDVKVGGDIKGAVQTMSGDVSARAITSGNISTMSGDVRVT